MNWKTKSIFDLYDLSKNEITKKDIFRCGGLNISKGQELISYDEDNVEIKDVKKYVILDYIEFCDRNDQIVYACLEDLREEKLKSLGL